MNQTLVAKGTLNQNTDFPQTKMAVLVTVILLSVDCVLKMCQLGGLIQVIL